MERRDLRHDHRILVQRALHQRALLLADIVPLRRALLRRAVARHVERRGVGLLEDATVSRTASASSTPLA